jgi:hypothetical protein
MQSILPTSSVIIELAEIIDMVSITKGAVLGGEISGTRGRKAGGISGNSSAPKVPICFG